MHSWVSDGDVSPTEVVQYAVKGGLDVIALTDHDTAAGVGEALAEAQNRPVTVIPGIEISTRWEEYELHILGYGIDWQSEPILEHQRRAVQRRYDRMVAMVDRLQAIGLSITVADVEEAAGGEVQTLGRPHLARALFAKGQTRFYSDAFNRFIGDEGPGFVAEGFPTPEYAIETIHAAGGSAVWAHPPPAWYSEGVGLLAGWGLDGVECWRPGVDPEVITMFQVGAREHGLFLTGGSDWHGPERWRLGEFSVPAEWLGEVLAAGGIRSSS